MSQYPKGLPRNLQRHWRWPWKVRSRKSPKFRRWLDKHGYITPHFRWNEARCKDGTAVPSSLRRNAIRHAWNLERLRHELGDRPIAILSWYRHRAYNKKIGGASQSQHIRATATDHPQQWINAVGRTRFFSKANRIFANGGVGRYPSGSGHTDSRGWRARWSSF